MITWWMISKCICEMYLFLNIHISTTVYMLISDMVIILLTIWIYAFSICTNVYHVFTLLMIWYVWNVWIWLVWRKYMYNTDDRMTWIIDFRLCHTIRNYLSSSINLFICLLICSNKKEPIYKFLLRHDNSTGDDIVLM